MHIFHLSLKKFDFKQVAKFEIIQNVIFVSKTPLGLMAHNEITIF